MAIYSVYLPDNQSGGDAAEYVRFISDSKSPMALVFPPLWLVWHRLWLELLVYAVFAFAIALLAIWKPVPPVLYLSAIPGIYLLLEGNELIRRHLERSGWRFAGVVDASNREEAEIRYFHQHQSADLNQSPAQQAPTIKPFSSRAAPAGLFPE